MNENRNSSFDYAAFAERTGVVSDQLTSPNQDTAASLPLSQLVDKATAAGRSPERERAYRNGIGIFLRWLGPQLPHGFQMSLVTSHRYGRRTMWTVADVPSAVLWAVNADLLDAYAVSLNSRAATVAARMNAVRVLLSVAYRDGVLSEGQVAALGINLNSAP